jgi:hypothetical protein
VWGIVFHTVVECVAVGYILFKAIGPGTPVIVQKHWDFYQILGWALAVDLLLFEPVKNKLMMVLRGLVSDYDGRKKAEEDEAANIRRYDQVVSGKKSLPATDVSFSPPTARPRGMTQLEEYIDDDGFDEVVSQRSGASGFLDMPADDLTEFETVVPSVRSVRRGSTVRYQDDEVASTASNSSGFEDLSGYESPVPAFSSAYSDNYFVEPPQNPLRAISPDSGFEDVANSSVAWDYPQTFGSQPSFSQRPRSARSVSIASSPVEVTFE